MYADRNVCGMAEWHMSNAYTKLERLELRHCLVPCRCVHTAVSVREWLLGWLDVAIMWRVDEGCVEGAWFCNADGEVASRSVWKRGMPGCEGCSW
jgi:hypothetical protein